jgi:uncharacterized Rossmann fold enzyme
MTFLPLKITGKCIAGDEELFANMDAAIARGYPEIAQAQAHEGMIALIGSGPSVAEQLEVIGKMQDAGTPIVAIKDAHDWLIESGIVPDYAFAIDPQEHRWNCFKQKNKKIHYVIASQCHKAMFDHLEGHRVTIWHPYITKGQKRPSNKMLIGGGTTSGLRAISLFYVLGYRHFALFGFDSCLDKGVLRVNGNLPKDGDKISEVRIDPEGETFYCTPSMALQAEHFQTYYDAIPDAVFYPYGHGLIQAMILQREKNGIELQSLMDAPKVANDRVSFIHRGGPEMASYRYRAQIPCCYLHGTSLDNGEHLKVSMNDLTADTLIFSKPLPQELMDMARGRARGAWVVVDICDDHFDWPHYREALRLADKIICGSPILAEKIKELGYDSTVVRDPYEFPETLPHCNGTKLLWFGHSVNKHSLQRILPEIAEYPLVVVSNFGGAIPWSMQTLFAELDRADIFINPATEKYKGSNRTLEAIRSGCFVVAEPHPAIMDIPGIWIGNIKEGIQWAQQNPQLAREWTSEAQKYVETNFSPQTITAAWRKAIQRPTILDVALKSGTDG